jgi:glycosyltransferase involved in cell wall biosynthesis
MLSVIIPSYNEPYLGNTLKSILENATGKIEVFVNVDDGIKVKGKWDSRITFNYSSSPIGMRGGINKGLRWARGKYIMKCDAHCVFAPGFDKEITGNMEDDWLAVPRRQALYADEWRADLRFPPKDYHYLCYPVQSKFGLAMFPVEWKERVRARQNFEIDDTMIIQGSCYVANRKYFLRRVGFLDDREETYTPFGGEQMEIGLKYWLGGGAIKVNKRTWYAHLFKNSRYYREVAGDMAKQHKRGIKSKGSWEWSTRHWLRNEEPDMIHKFSWLIEKFNPPTWPQNKKLWQPT